MRKAVGAGYLLVMLSLAGVSAHAVFAAREARPFVLADVDGDGKKDGFYRTQLPDRVELGVRLTKYQNKYLVISQDEELKDNRNSKVYITNRKKFLESIRCDPQGGCPDYRRQAISDLEGSISPQVVVISYKFTGKALLMNEKGEVVEAWYSD